MLVWILGISGILAKVGVFVDLERVNLGSVLFSIIGNFLFLVYNALSVYFF